MSPKVKKLAQAKGIFETATRRARDRSLALISKTAVKRAPYQAGQLKREIKPIFSAGKIVAGTHLSKKYAPIQEFGGIIRAKNHPYLVWKDKNGNWHKAKQVKIPAKKYFYSSLRDRTPEVLQIYKQEIRRALA